MTIQDDEAIARRLQQQEDDAQMARDVEAEIRRQEGNTHNAQSTAQAQTTTTSPVVVQGQAVSNPYSSPPTSNNYNYNVSSGMEMEQERPYEHTPPTRQTKCQDVMFAPLFYLAIAAIAIVAGIFGGDALASSTNPFSDQYDGYIYSSLVAICVGLVLSAGGLQVMMMIPQIMIKAALIFSVVMAGLVAFWAFSSGSFFFAILALFFFAITCCYAYFVWSRIPFATVNLVTGISSIKANCGITVFAYVFVLFAAASKGGQFHSSHAQW